MTKINRDKERQRCRQFYERWEFIKRIVELYVEGVSWKGCKVIAPNDPDKIPSQYSQIINDDALKDGVRDMLVDGIGKFNLKVVDSVRVLPILMPSESPVEKPGRPFLWPPTLNAKALENMVSLLGTSPDAAHMVKIIKDDMCRFLGVSWLLLQNIVTTDPTAVMWGLTLFKHRVGGWRTHIAFQMTKAVKPLISKALNYTGLIEVVWNEEWHQSGVICDYGPVYQVFKAQGIELRTLREEVLNATKSARDNSLISKQTYEESVKWFIK